MLISKDIKFKGRYLAFYCPEYGAAGGMGDCVGAFETIGGAEAAITAEREKFRGSAHVFDVVNGSFVGEVKVRMTDTSGEPSNAD